MNNKSYDVIVVGAGNAALCAALSAREQGANVLVLERAPQEKRGGNSAFTGGGFRMVHHGLEDIKKFVPDLTQKKLQTPTSANIRRSSFSTTWAASLSTVSILTWRRSSCTAAPIPCNGSGRRGYALRISEWNARFQARGPHQVLFFRSSIAMGGGRGLIDAEFKAAEKHGITIRYNARATSLLHGRAGVEGAHHRRPCRGGNPRTCRGARLRRF